VSFIIYASHQTRDHVKENEMGGVHIRALNSFTQHKNQYPVRITECERMNPLNVVCVFVIQLSICQVKFFVI